MKALRIFHVLIRHLGLFEMAVSVSFLGAVITLIFAQVIARYLFNQPQAWIEELCTYMFIWIVFFGSSAAMKLDRHIRVASFEEHASDRTKIFLRLLSASVTVGALVTVAYHAEKFVGVEMRSTSIALPVNVPRAFFFSIPLIWACLSISLSALYILARDLTHMLTGERLPPPFSIILDEADR